MPLRATVSRPGRILGPSERSESREMTTDSIRVGAESPARTAAVAAAVAGRLRAGDVVLRNAGGDEILRCAGVPQPERFKHVIVEARDARMQSDEALAAINKRR